MTTEDTGTTDTLAYSETTYSDGQGDEYVAVQIDWTDVTSALGHQHRGTPDDDAVLRGMLVAAGAPAWVASLDATAGWLDEAGWGLYCTLRADRINDGWTVVDQGGARWLPKDKCDREIEASDDPEAIALAICLADPTRGEWCS